MSKLGDVAVSAAIQLFEPVENTELLLQREPGTCRQFSICFVIIQPLALKLIMCLAKKKNLA